MGIFDLFKGWFGMSQKEQEETIKSVFSGLDISSAFEAHKNWSKRLMDSAQGRSTEVYDHATVCRDDKCALGKWLHGDGNKTYHKIPVFEELINKHAHFHVEAGKIVSLLDRKAGKDEILSQLNEGSEYAKASHAVLETLDVLEQKTHGRKMATR